jgi:hypothetical protein
MKTRPTSRSLRPYRGWKRAVVDEVTVLQTV